MKLVASTGRSDMKQIIFYVLYIITPIRLIYAMYIKVHRMKNRPKLYFLKCTRCLQCTWGVRTSANARLNTMHPSTSVPAGPIRAGTGKVEIIISTGQHYGRPTTRQLDPARGHGKAWRQAQFQCQANACPPPSSPHHVHVVSVKARYSLDTFCRAAILAIKGLLTDPKWHVPVVRWTVSKFSNAPQIYFKYSSYNV